MAHGVFASLPTTVVGLTSAPQNVQITLASASPIGSITVPMAQNGVQEFKVGTVTGCAIGGSSNPANTVCTVPITFSPQYPGTRMGTLTVNNDGEVIGTAGLAGIGQGPEIAVTPGTLAMAIGGGVNGVTTTPQSVTTAALSVSNNGAATAMDGAGNLYIADNINCLAYKVIAATNQIVVVAGNYTFAAGAVTPSTTPEPAIGSNTCPIAIAVDGAGNIYLADANVVINNAYGAFPGVVEEVSAATGEIVVVAGNPNSTLTATTTPQPALNVAIQAVNSLATDAAGNLYISDFFNNLVEQVTPNGQIVVFAGGGSNGGPFTTPQPATSVSLNGPTGMVMDEFGNFYISDQNINLIEMVNAAGQIVTVAGGGGTTPSTTPQNAFAVGFNCPAGLAVDGAGDLYIADFCNDMVEQLNLAGQVVVVAGSGGTVPSATPISGTNASLGIPQGVEVDGAGNLYIADGQNIGGGDNMVEKVSTVGAPLNFPYTNAGSSSAPQSVTLTNIGNEPLVLSSVSAPADYPSQTTGSQTLPSGNNGSLTFAFDPHTGGVLDESATLIDNNLNVANAQQSLAFTGTAFGGPAATPTFSLAGGNYSEAQSVTISDTTPGAAIYYTTNGTTPTTSSALFTSGIILTSTETLEAIATASYYSTSAVATANYTLTLPAVAPTVTVTLSPSTITTAQALTATIGVSGGTGTLTATGTVTLSGGGYTSSAAQLVSGTAQINVPVGSLAIGTYSLTATYLPDNNSSSIYIGTTATAPVTVMTAVPAGFTISGTAITVASGATTENTSTITLTPAGGFTGTVSLSCAIAPVATNDPATCSIQPASITVSGTTAKTTTLTVNTSGTTSSLNQTNKLFWPSASGTALALLFLFGIPARRRHWRTWLGMALLLLAICGAVPGCGGATSSTTPRDSIPSP